MKEIRINVTNATDTQIEWLKEMFRIEIDDARGTADNKYLWALGSDDEDNEFQHKENGNENLAYAEMLEDALNQLKINERR